MNALRHAPALLALCLLSSAAAAASAGTREPRMHGPGGDGGECTQADAGTASDASSDAASDATIAAAKPGTTPAVKPAGTHIKPAITVRGGSDDGSNVHAPRWHSFLPGMFR
jgi:hypothetical protein